MERASLIIKKLQQLVDENASADILLAIAQMLVTELQQVQQPDELRSVYVTIPRRNFIVEETTKQEEAIVKEETPLEIVANNETTLTQEEVLTEKEEEEVTVEEKKDETINQQPYSWNIQQEETTPIESPREEYILSVQEEPEVPIAAQAESQHTLEETPNSYFFESNTDIPTLPQVEKPNYELNQALAKEENDINNSLKEHKVEVAHLHENTQIKDLKRAISINEKYLFINELFRGDEELYDKCIKHIQLFSVHSEAAYWIQKELKTKLEWRADDEVVELFDQLVKRRFL